MEEERKARDRWLILAAIALSLLLVGSCFAIPYLLTSSGSGKGTGKATGTEREAATGPTLPGQEELERLLLDSDAYARASRIVEQNYVDEVEDNRLLEAAARGMRRMAMEGEDPEALVERGIVAMLDSLDDPFTSFMSREELEMLDTQLSGHFSGVGIAMRKVKNEIMVVQVLEGTPAQEAGIREGDVVKEVDGRDVTAMDLDEVVMLIRGPEGTTVSLGIYRPSSPELLRFEIVRREIQIPVLRKEVKEGGVGYIQLTDWTEDADQRIREALSELEGEGARSLVIDLRSNTGGYMDPAINAADLFLRQGVIVTSRGRVPGTDREYQADAEASWDLPLVVLVNRGTASSSEIFAAALRDNQRCTLVGETTFGKGSIQKIFRQEDGTGIRLTIARYYTPQGVNLDEEGLVPEVLVKNPVVGEEDLQLEKALEIARTST